MTTPPGGRRVLPWIVLGVVVMGLIATAAVVILLRNTGDVSHPGVGFVATTDTTNTPSGKIPIGRHPADDRFEWPVYGYTKARTRELPLNTPMRPPFTQRWAVRGRVLLEFTPVLCHRSLFLLKNNGAIYAVSRTTGHVRWKRKLGSLAAASPACSHGTVYAVLLAAGTGGGRVVALSTKTGRTRWSRQLPSRSESSPLLDRGRLFFGTENGTVYSLRSSDGAIRWTFKAGGAVKGGIALDANRLYFGDYGGQVYAIRRGDGHQIWSVSTSGAHFGLSSGNFYSTAAVEYGRVYIGNTDGNVYSFAASNGKLAWRKHTGNFVYASPAVGQPPGTRPSVYIGSYDGNFYALDARSGAPVWTRRLGSKISGSATIVGDLVFVADLGSRTTWALGASTGKTVWKTHRGGFNPLISDGRRLYLTGLTSLFALDPQGHPFDTASAARARAAIERARAKAKHG